jgi:hypothetical protein
MADVNQPVINDSIKFYRVSHYRFSWVAEEPGKSGTYIPPVGAGPGCLGGGPHSRPDNLQDLLENTSTVPLRRRPPHADVRGRQGRRPTELCRLSSFCRMDRLV